MRIKKIFSLLLIATMLGTLIPSTVLAESRENINPQLTKKAEWVDQDSGLAKITLEAKGNPVVIPKKGADVVVVMDYSGSMEYSVSQALTDCGKEIKWKKYSQYYNYGQMRWMTIYTGRCSDGHHVDTIEIPSEQATPTQFCTQQVWKITETRWQAAKSALSTLLGQIFSGNNGNSEVSFVAFDSNVNDEYLHDFTNDGNSIMNLVNGLSDPKAGESNKGTNYTAGLKGAKAFIESRTDKTKPLYVVFLSDGEPWDGSTYNGQNQISEIKRLGAKVYTIGFALDPSRDWRAINRLSSYASEPEYFKNVQTSSELDHLFDNIGESIANPGVTVWDTIDTRYFTVAQKQGTNISYEASAGVVEYTNGKTLSWHLDNFSASGAILNIYVQLKDEYRKTGQSYPTNEVGTARGTYIDSDGTEKILPVTEDNISTSVPKLPTNKVHQVIFDKGEHGKLKNQDTNGQIVINNILAGSPFPTKPEIIANPGYQFTGWSPTLPSNVTENQIYVAQYTKSTENWKTVTFAKGTNGTLENQNAEGKVVIEDILVGSNFPEAPKVNAEKGYRFIGWNETLPDKVTETKTYTAVYEKVATDWRTVSFAKGEHGTLKGQDVNGNIILPEILTGSLFPTVPEVTAEKGYKFTGWSPVIPETVTETKTYVAQYEKLAEDWKTVTFEKGTNGTLENQNAEGKVVIEDILVGSNFPEAPKVSAEKGYKFTGWSPSTTETVTETATYVAQYEKVAEDWKTITFDKGSKGTLLGQNTNGQVVVENALVGEAFPTAPEITVEKGYKFTGWSPVLPNVVEETKVYIAQYEKVDSDWKTVTFAKGDHGTLEGEDRDGQIVISDILVGSNFPKAPKVSAEKGYKFAGWSPNATATVTDTATYVAQYEKVAEDWKTVTFAKGTNGTLENQNTEGKVVVSDILVGSNFPEAPKVTPEKGYKFTGWSPNATATVTETATYVAQYMKLPTVTFKVDSTKSNSEGKVIFVEPGTKWEDLSKPETPVGKEVKSDSNPNVYKKYEFVAWGEHPRTIENDEVVEAVFETYATIQQEEIYFKEGSNTPESSLSSNSYNVNKAESNFNYTNEDIKEHDGYIYKVSGKQVFVNGKAINSGDNNINFDLTSIQGQFPDETVHVKNIYKEIDRHYVVYQTESQDEVTNMPKGDDTIFYDGYNKQFIVSKVEPKRDGYTFVGWKPSTESSKVFKVGEQIVVSNKDFDFSQKNLIMQAIWEPNEEVWNYNVKYYKYGETEPYSVSENTVLKRSNKVTSIADRAPEYYKLKGYQFNDGSMSKTLLANITKDGQVIKVYYEKNDLIVKHVYGDLVIYDKEQSKADASDKLTIKSVNNGRYNRVNTLSINGVAQTPQTTITLDFTKDNKYEVVFAYGSKSGGSTTDPGDNTNPGGNPSPGGKDNGYFGEPVEILEEEVPLAAGLESIDHFAYVFGYEDNTARPKNKISREEVSTIFYRLMTDDLRDSMTTLTQGFPDVKNTRWSNKPIATLANGKIIGGYPDGSFKPGSSITRAEFAAIVSRFDNLNYQGTDKFSDIKGHWAAATINAAAERGWIGGYPDGTFRPNAYITRAEAMALINKVLNRHVSEKGLLPDARYWKDNSINAWYYEDVMEATNSHDYTRDEATGIETWTIIKPDKVWP